MHHLMVHFDEAQVIYDNGKSIEFLISEKLIFVCTKGSIMTFEASSENSYSYNLRDPTTLKQQCCDLEDVNNTYISMCSM